MSAAAFALRLDATEGTDSPNPATAARLARLDRRGWQTARFAQRLDVSATGPGLICEAGGQVVCGIVFLDNRPAVLAQLGQEDGPQSDLELAAMLYAAQGRDFVTVLSGSFSLAVFDPATGALEGYRDHFGIYPFYYCRVGDALTCASDPRAALHLSGLPLEPDETRLADFVVGRVVDTEITAFAGLRRLPAAHRLEVVRGAPEIRRYWRLEPGPEVPEKEAAQALYDRLHAATAARMRPPGVVGAMLSGGLNSSSLAGLAARTARQRGLPPLRTLSFVFPGRPYDERAYIDAANYAYGTDPHFIEVTEIPRIVDLRDVVEEQMDLFGARGLNNSRRIYAEGRLLGLQALLHGHGGDEVISLGYRRLVELAARRRWLALYRNLYVMEPDGGRAFWAMYLAYIAQNGGFRKGRPVRRLLMAAARRLVAGQGSQTAPPAPAVDLLAPALRDRIAVATRYAPDPPLTDRNEQRSAERILSLRHLQSPMMENGFEALHRAAGVAGVEVRYPFYDRAVVELCVSMPSSVKLRQGQTRWVLKQAMRGLLPDMIRTRNTKANFHDEVDEGLVAYHRAEPHALCYRMAPYVDMDEAVRIRDRVVAGDHSIQDSICLWQLTVLTFWLDALEEWRARQADGTLM